MFKNMTSKDRKAILFATLTFFAGLFLAVAGKLFSDYFDSPVWTAGLYLACMMLWLLSADILTDAMSFKSGSESNQTRESASPPRNRFQPRSP
jgi:hypothetical protein